MLVQVFLGPKAKTTVRRMEPNLLVKHGRALYRRRGQAVEPLFGQMTGQQGVDRFLTGVQEGCKSESCLRCVAHNLPKLHR